MPNKEPEPLIIDDTDDDLVEVEVITLPFDRDVERKKEYRKLIKAFSGLEDHNLFVAKSLCSELAECKVQMMEHKFHFEREGMVETYTQGPNKYKKQNPSYTSYVNAQKMYSTLYRQITQLFPKTNTTLDDDEVDEYDQLMADR